MPDSLPVQATTSAPATTEPQPSPTADAKTSTGKTGVRSALRQLMGCRNFRAIALVNAVMFATANGSRAVLMPLLAVQGFGMKTTYLGGQSYLCCFAYPPILITHRV